MNPGNRKRGGRPRKHPVLNGPFNDLIFEAMRREGIDSLDKFADKYGIGRTTLRNFVLGRQSPIGTWVKPELPTLIKLSKALSVPLFYLLERLYNDLGQDVYMLPSAPVVGWVGAGPGQDESIEELSLPLSLDSFLKGDFLAFAVRGNSMCAGSKPICDGDYIIVNRSLSVSPGQRVVARLKDGSYVCKLYRADRTGHFLVSSNPDYENGTPSVIPAQEVDEIVGPVIEVRKPE
ncbi:MAG: hypothetical protein KatS3mg073_1019 [Meiothermus sp.]|nr:MAG: hypothetical protein KatS3mg073_1019 [Meiothermus sp.]